MLALPELDLDELERDLLRDQDESGAAGSTGRVSSVEFDHHDQLGLREGLEEGLGEETEEATYGSHCGDNNDPSNYSGS